MIKKPTVEEIKEIIAKADSNRKSFILKELKEDNRSGIQKELKKIRKEHQIERLLRQNFRKLSKFESNLYSQGFQYIAGVDESGRGPLAGPLVASAVILPKDCYIAGLKDCKLLLPEQREQLYEEIIAKAIDFSIAEVSSFEIDGLGLHKANLKVLKLAVAKLNNKPDFVLSDGFNVEMPYPSLKIIKGDMVSVSIAAASIVAKVHRDRLMDGYHAAFPQYGLDKHKGYGTKDHKEALKKYGPSAIHRQIFEPVRLTSDESPRP